MSDDEIYSKDGVFKFETIGKWVKGIKLDLESGFFVAWDRFRTVFYDFKIKNKPWENVKKVVDFPDLVTEEDFIIDILFFNVLHYIVVATNLGNLIVYKWDPK